MSAPGYIAGPNSDAITSDWIIHEVGETLFIGPARTDGNGLSEVVCSFDLKDLTPQAANRQHFLAGLVAQAPKWRRENKELRAYLPADATAEIARLKAELEALKGINQSASEKIEDQRKECHSLVSKLKYRDQQLADSAAERVKLQAFKDYVHKRLDDAGVPADPESTHKAEGCRIGGRLDVALNSAAREAKLRELLSPKRKYELAKLVMWFGSETDFIFDLLSELTRQLDEQALNPGKEEARG